MDTKEISEEAKARFFEEAGICLKRGGFQVGPVEEGYMPVSWQDAPLCRVNGVGGIRYRSEVVRDPDAGEALNRVLDIINVTDEYMRLLEKAPQLNATGLDESYKCLNEFNGAVLAAHHSSRGWDFVTWCRDYSGEAVTQGHYVGGDYEGANGKFSMELVRDWVEDHERTETALLGDFNAAVRLRMEEIVAENREKYAAQVLTSSRLKAELEHYREYESREDAARRLLIASAPANIRFKARFEHRKWGDELIQYLKDRESTVEEAARDCIAHGGEEILLDFLKADILRERYIELLKDPSDPAYTVKAVSDAVEKSHAKYVKVTISKGGPEVTVVTEAAGSVGYHSFYDPGCLLSADKEAFEQAFGKYADYTAQDIVRIARGTKTIYEASKGGE